MLLQVTGAALDDLLGRDWLTVNHSGGYASSTPVGLNTRKYHGLLVAAMTPPVRRMVLLSRIEETVYVNGRAYPLAASEYPGTISPRGFEHLVAFDHEPFPRWAYQGDGWTIIKELHLVPGRNTVCLTYTLLGGTGPVQLAARPMLAMRGIHELMFQSNGRSEAVMLSPGHYRVEATSRTPEVFFASDGQFESQPLWYLNNIYRRERERGYAGLEDLWTPGLVRWMLYPGRKMHFVCSADPINLGNVLADIERHESTTVAAAALSGSDAADALRRAAAQFVPMTSGETGPRRSIILTQAPWAPPSGRDALIAFPGLLLVPRRFAEAKAVLQSLAADLWNGLLPSEFPEDGSAPRYNGADVSLWFVHAVHQYLKYTGEAPAANGSLVEAVGKIIEAYHRGTTLGIGTDTDGLLSTHAAGIPTTWMDAKVGDWVVTPRQGRPVELNALWYNALCIGADLMSAIGRVARSEEWAMLAVSVKHAFNRRFWNEHAGCCFDVVTDHGVDPSIRPNQLLAISLPYPLLAAEHHLRALATVHDQLLTPYGLRSLAASDTAYCGRYEGDPVSRDRAYHQGTVYPWFLGAYADAMLRVHGNSRPVREQIRKVLTPCIDHLCRDGMGLLCELFDGDVPHRPAGAIACARSVGELTRAYVEGVLGIPAGPVDSKWPEPLELPVRSATDASSPEA